MRPLLLDFQPRRHKPILGASLLLAAILLAVVCAALYRHLDEQEQLQQQQLQHAQHQLGGDVPGKAGLSPAESREQEQNLAQMRQVSQQMRRPWERLFAMLESLPQDDVALLSLTPDARKGQVRISAEARNLEAMLDFHRRLENSDELSDVSLLNHEILAQSPDHAVQFNLSATWEISDANP